MELTQDIGKKTLLSMISKAIAKSGLIKLPNGETFFISNGEVVRSDDDGHRRLVKFFKKRHLRTLLDKISQTNK